MIITEQKSLEDIVKMLEGYDKIVIVGCNTCSALCQTGGEEEIKEMVERLKDKKQILATVAVESPCDLRISKRDLRTVQKQIEEADAILAMTCGVGVQSIADLTRKTVVPALDTKFLGMVERLGRFYERCRMCGSCTLFDTGGICAISRCPKELLNGPCEMVSDGKCEVGGWKNDCVWVQICDRMKQLGRLEDLKKYQPERDGSLRATLGEVVWTD
ncbi:MAG: methylenetetrahydrofolate reductase C-terminal domain-containing protein [Candidatus Atabeyarchaeum deiterrae]